VFLLNIITEKEVATLGEIISLIDDKLSRKLYSLIFKILSNETRLLILKNLTKQKMVWDELLHATSVNPKSLSEHLKVLQKHSLVEKAEPHGYQLTNLAKMLLDVPMKDVKTFLEKTLLIANAATNSRE